MAKTETAAEKAARIKKQREAEAKAQAQKIAQEKNLDPNQMAAANVDSKTASKSMTKLTPASAKALLQEQARTSQYMGEITDADVKDFMAKFNAEQAKQVAEVVKVAKSRVTQGASIDAVQNEINNILTTEYPSFFKPTEFASDYLWSKMNFSKPETLGGKALTAIKDVRSVLRGFGPLDYSDAEISIAAQKIARGQMSVDEFRSIISQKAVASYPQYAERLAAAPGYTIRDLASPYINLMAKELELDPESIELDDPMLDKALRPDGTAGKLPTMSLADFRIALRNSPKWENTTAANESARSAATSLARAFGFGV